MKPRRLISLLCAVGGCLLLTASTFAATKGPVSPIVRVTVDPSALIVEPEEQLNNGRIRLLSPEGLEIVRDFKGGAGMITVNELAEELEELSLDGCWTYEIVGDPVLTTAERDLLERSRESGRPVPASLQLKLESMSQTGSFIIEEGRMTFDPNPGETDIDGKLRAEVPTQLDTGVGISAEAPTGLEHQVISGDLVVYNSICVGFDCPTNPSFGADTIRLQENNLRIHFDDTSTAASYPRTDWRIIANDQANGGLSRFSVEDSSANRIPFTIEASAPSNSLYVEDSGDLGLGTSNPVADIHAVDGDSPFLRLDQNTSSGFAAQVWDVAGNETSFFVRDATNGSTLPFRIRPGASSNSLVIDSDDDVGIGVLSPEVELHVLATGEAPTDVQFKIEANTDPAFDFEEQDSGVTWRFINNNTDLKIVDVGTGADGAEELVLNQAGNLTITGSIFTGGGTCGGGCDRVFQPDFEVKTIEEHAAEMWSNSYLPAVGPTQENAPINLSEKTGRILHELEIAHIYIDQLNQTIQELKGDLKQKDENVLALAERLAALEEALEVAEQ